MRGWGLLVALGAVLGMLAASAQAQTATEDSVVGQGRAVLQPGVFLDFDINARSGPTAENPNGRVSFVNSQGSSFEGRVTCLAVTGNAAVIGVQTKRRRDFKAKGALFFVEDKGGPGSGLDTLDAEFTASPPTVCNRFGPNVPSTVTDGDIVVTDA